MNVSLLLAAEDLLPPLLAAVGLLAIRRIGALRRRSAGSTLLAGTILVTAGGLSRASWKVVLGLGGPDIEPLHDLLFPMLGPGFALLALGVVAARGTPWLTDRRLQWSIVGVGIVSAGLGLLVIGPAGSRIAELALIGLATSGNLVFGVVLVRTAVETGLPVAAGLFLANLLAVFILAGLARVDDQTLGLQVVEQVVNTLAQAGFLLAARSLERAGRWQPVADPAATP